LVASSYKLKTGSKLQFQQDPELDLTLAEPLLAPMDLGDYRFYEKMTNFDRQNIPARVVHSKGTGAFGYFTVTNPMTQYTRASVFNETGKRTEVMVRFSKGQGQQGVSDTLRDFRGMAVKLYSDTGNYDIVCNNVPIFFFKDASYSAEFVSSQNRCPVTNISDPTRSWYFFVRHLESFFAMTILYSDLGTPASYRHMGGHPAHTFKWVNDNNEVFWVKYHFLTEQGLQFLTNDRSNELAGEDPDYYGRDLYTAIDNGDFPSWILTVQIMPEAEAASFEWDINDPTRVWPDDQYPPQEIGRLVLNRIPQDHQAEIEMARFCPSELIDGVEPSNDIMLRQRMFAYQDAQLNRLGKGVYFLASNRPYGQTFTNPTNEEPPTLNMSNNLYMQAELAGLLNLTPADDGSGSPHNNDDLAQLRTYYDALSDAERERIHQNLAGYLSLAGNRQIQERMVELLTLVDERYGQGVDQYVRYANGGSTRASS